MLLTACWIVSLKEDVLGAYFEALFLKERHLECACAEKRQS